MCIDRIEQDDYRWKINRYLVIAPTTQDFSLKYSNDGNSDAQSLTYMPVTHKKQNKRKKYLTTKNMEDRR